MSLSKLWEMVKDREAWHAPVRRVAKSRAWLNNTIQCLIQDRIMERVSAFRSFFLVNCHQPASVFIFALSYIVRGSVERILQTVCMLAGRLPQWAQRVKNLPVMWEAPETWTEFTRERNVNPLQYSCLKNPTERGASGLQSMGSERVRHNWATQHRCLPS